jgi:hypothetical protein
VPFDDLIGLRDIVTITVTIDIGLPDRRAALHEAAIP